MKPILPDPEATKRKGWTHQVQWVEAGKPCFIRCRSKAHAVSLAEKLADDGDAAVIFNLEEEFAKQ